jgi:hypothetical protein
MTAARVLPIQICNGNYKHGRYTAEVIASRKWLRQFTRGVRALTKETASALRSEEMTKGEEVMTGKTEEDFREWVYKYLDGFSKEIGQDWTPIDVFPVWTRVMVEWCDATSCHGVDRQHAQALAAAIGELTSCLKRVLALPPGPL